MGRPPLLVGTFGKVSFMRRDNGTIQARAKYRDYDGRVRLVSKSGSSRAAAERSLKEELTHRQTPASSGATSSGTRVDELADVWLAFPHGWSTGTQRTYQSAVRSQIRPALGALRIAEVSPGVISRALTAMAARSGPGSAKTARACLSGMFTFAVQDGAIAANPVRDASAKITMTRKAPRALTVSETERLRCLLRDSPRACELDMPDLVDWMLATGCRIGEALALRYGSNANGKPLLDLAARTWEVNATVVRVPGRGLTIQPRTKTASGWRVLALPDRAVHMLERRAAAPERWTQSDPGVVFTAPYAGSLRDPNNASGDLRALLDRFECPTCAARESGRAPRTAPPRPTERCTEGPWAWVTSHTFRKTVATRLDEAGLTPRQVADHLGHANPSMTLDVYFGRHVVSSAAATVLDR